MPDEKEIALILKERAKLLAREPKKEPVTAEAFEILEFALAYESYGVETSFVREVYPLKELTPLPHTPPFILGITNVRGQIVSIIDVKKFFDLPERGLTDLNKIIILHNDRMEFGVLADVIIAVRHIALKDIQPSLPTLTGIRQEYLKGVTPERLVILDAERLLSDSKMVVHEEAAL